MVIVTMNLVPHYQFCLVH